MRLVALSSGSRMLTGAAAQTWIHLNAAGSSPASDASHAATICHLELEKEMGGYAAASAAPADAHGAIARLLNCSAAEIALADSAQQAWARAFYSLNFRAGDRILCFENEYGGNAVAFLQAQQRCPGLDLEVLPMRSDGIIDVSALKTALFQTSGEAAPSAAAPPRVLVALTHVQTGSSIVQPAAAVGALCAQHGALYLLDACQSIGQLPVDVQAIGCTFASGTGRKWLRGPRGTGFLYVRLDALQRAPGAARCTGLLGEPPMIDHAAARWSRAREYALCPDARRYEMWERSEALRHGLMVAAHECAEIGPDAIFARARALAARLREGLARIEGCLIRDAPLEFDETTAAALGASRGAIVTFEAESTRHRAAVTIEKALAAARIAVSVSPPTHSFDEAHWARPSVVRISPHHFNTIADVDAALEVIRDTLAPPDIGQSES